VPKCYNKRKKSSQLIMMTMMKVLLNLRSIEAKRANYKQKS